ncbi:MAG TPA: TIM-barrel domain-containing protein [Phycisphaerae bacterium]|nr:TIM-barrel domain-containing protein [Phycisphaerae bacterium]
MLDRRDFLKVLTTTAGALAAVRAPVINADAGNTTAGLGAVTGAKTFGNELTLQIGADVLSITVLSQSIVRIDYLLAGKNDPQTPMIDPTAKFTVDPPPVIDVTSDPISVKTQELQLLISRNPCRLALVDAAGNMLMNQSANQSFFVDASSDKKGGVTFGRAPGNLYGLRAYDLWTNDTSILRNGDEQQNNTYIIEARQQGGGGSPMFWSPTGYGMLVDTDGGYVRVTPNEVEFYYGVTNIAEYRRRYHRPNSVQCYLFVGPPAQILKNAALVTGMMPMFPKWSYGFTNTQWGSDENELKTILNTYRAQDIPIDNFCLDFDWKAWGQDNYGEFRWNPVKYSTALLEPGDPKSLLSWTTALTTRITGIMKPRIIMCTTIGQTKPLTKEYASATQLGIIYPDHPPFIDYVSNLFANDLDLSQEICRTWYWNATWRNEAMQRGIVGFWNDEADYPDLDNFEFLHMQQSLFEGQMQARPNQRAWSINRNFYLGSQRFAYATWSGDIHTGFGSMAHQPLRMMAMICLGQMRWSMDSGGFVGHPDPENYARWIQFSSMVPVFRVHGVLNEKRQPWVYGDQAAAIAKAAMRLRYSLFPYTYAADHQACTQTAIGLVRPLVIVHPEDPVTEDLHDEWMFGDYLLAAPVLTPLGTDAGQSMTRRVYLPAGNWIDFYRGDPYAGGQWIDYQLNEGLWTDHPLFIKQGAIIPTTAPVPSIDFAIPELINLDIFPSDQQTQGEFYDDDGKTFDYRHGGYHRQVISVQNLNENNVNVNIGAREGTYVSTVKHFVVRIHGKAAADVTVDGSALTQIDKPENLKNVDSGWSICRDVYGPVTLIKLPAGSNQMQQISATGTAAVDIPLETQQATEASLTGTWSDQRAFIDNDHTGYTGDGFIAGLDQEGRGATFYFSRNQAGRYLANFRLANGSGSPQTLNVYVNGIFFGPLTAPTLSDWDSWQDVQMYLPLGAGLNIIMLRNDQENSGRINLNSITVPYEPSA